MASIHYRTIFLGIAAAIVGFGWLYIALVQPGGPQWPGMLTIALLLGTMFGQASLAGAWCALGPYALIRRLPLSFAWVTAIALAFGCNLSWAKSSNGLVVFLVYAAAVMGQWLFVQAPLWLLAGRFGLRIVSCQENVEISKREEQQFGIREVMVLTFLVALLLGAGRFMLGGLKSDGAMGGIKGALVFGFLALSNAIMAVPLIAGALAPRRALRAVGGALLIVALMTALELPLLALFWPGGKADWDDYLVFVFINAVQCAWILAVLLLARAGGFRLVAGDNC